MLFTQFNLEDAKRGWYRGAFEDGEEQDEVLKLNKPVYRKLQKGKAPETIAEEPEEPLQTIQQICIAASKCGPKVSTLDIYNQPEYK